MVNKITTPPTTSELIGKVNEIIDGKQDTLVSGTNIKTINNTSLLGSGDISVGVSNPLRIEKIVGTDTYFYEVGINNNNRIYAQCGVDRDGLDTLISLPTSYSFSGTDIDISYGSYSAEQEYIKTVSLSVGSNIARVSDIPTVNDSTITFTQGGTTKGTITLNQSSNQTIALDASDRNIGEIIQSTIPLTDAGLHLLDGSVISGDGVYKDFYNYIGSLVNTYPNLFITEAAWQAEVASHGVCGKFVLNTTDRTVRLPKITGFIEGTTDTTALGDLIEAGLPNITGNTTLRSSSRSADGAFYVNSAAGSAYAGTGVNAESLFGYSLDASRSSSIYGNSSTVQPQSIKVLYYIVIATSTKTDIQVDIDEIATDLNGKADIDFTNCNYIPMRSDVVHIVETYVNGTSWYRVYSDGWCEQGGFNANYGGTITLLKKMSNNTYTCLCCHNGSSAKGEGVIHAYNKTTTSFKVGLSLSTSGMYGYSWYVSGYIN